MNATRKAAPKRANASAADAKVSLNPLFLLRASIKAVPSVRYAFGVVGIAAAVSIVASLLSDSRVAIVGIVCALAFMIALVLFQRLSLLESRHFKLPALMLLWFIPVLLIAFLSLLFSSVFFGWPLTLRQWLEGAPRIEAKAEPAPAVADRPILSLTVPPGQSPYLAYRLQTVAPDFEQVFKQEKRVASLPVGFFLWPEVNLEKILFAVKAGTETSSRTFMMRADFVDEKAEDREASDKIWGVFREIGGALKKQSRASDNGAAVARVGQRVLRSLPSDDGVAGLTILRHVYYPHLDSAGVTKQQLAAFLIDAAKVALEPAKAAEASQASARIRQAAYFLATKQFDLILVVTVTNTSAEPRVLTGVVLDIRSVSKSASGVDSGPLVPLDTVRFTLQGGAERIPIGLQNPIKVAPKDAVAVRVAMRSDLLFSYLCSIQLSVSDGTTLVSPDFIVAFGFQPPPDAKPI